MNKRIYVCTTILLAALFLWKTVALAESAPGALLLDKADGSSIKITEIASNRPVILAFWTPRSPAAIRELEKLLVVTRELKEDITIIPISKGESDEEKRLAADKANSIGYKGTLYFDPDLKVVKSLRIKSVPWFAIRDAEGVVSGGFNSVETKPRNITSGKMLEMAAKGINIPYHEFVAVNSSDGARVLINKSAPAFSAPDITGAKRSPSQYKNKKPLFVVFWRESCPHCREEIPKLAAFYKKYSEKIPFEILSVAIAGDSTSVRKTLDFAAERDIAFPVIIDKDGKISSTYELSAVPAIIYVDEKGIIRETNVGNADDTEKLLLSFLNI